MNPLLSIRILTKSCWALGILFLALSPFSLSAQTIDLLPPSLTINSENQRINDPNWTAYRRGGTGYPLYQETYHGHEWLRIARTDINNDAQLMYNTPLADIAGSVILGASIWNDPIGLIMRSSNPEYATTTAYYLAVNASGIQLYYGVGAAFASSGITLASSSHPDEYSMKVLNPTGTADAQYRLEFSFIGNQLDARLYELATAPGEQDLFVTSLTYTDTRPEYLAEGYFGLRGGRFSNSNRHASFRNLSITVIPEPTAVASWILLSAGGLILVRRRIQKR